MKALACVLWRLQHPKHCVGQDASAEVTAPWHAVYLAYGHRAGGQRRNHQDAGGLGVFEAGVQRRPLLRSPRRRALGGL